MCDSRVFRVWFVALCCMACGTTRAAEPWDGLPFEEPLRSALIARLGSGHLRGGWRLAFSPDGKLLVSASVLRVDVFDVESGRPLRMLTCERPALGGLGGRPQLFFTPDGKELVYFFYNVNRWRFPSFEPLYPSDVPTDARARELYVARLRNMRYAKVRAGTGLAVVDAATGKEQLQFGRGVSFDHSALTADQRLLLTARYVDGAPREARFALEVWDVAARRLRHRLATAESTYTRLAATADGSVVVASAFPRPVQQWDGRTGELVRSYPEEHGGELAISPDRKKLRIGRAMFDLATGRELWRNDAMRQGDVVYSPDSRLAACSGRAIGLFNVETGRQPLPHRGHTVGISDVCFSPDGLRLVTGNPPRDRFCVWNARSGELIKESEDAVSTAALLLDAGEGPPQPVNESLGGISTGKRLVATDVGFAPMGRRFVQVERNEVRFWNRDGSPAPGPIKPKTVVSAIAMSADGSMLAVGGRELAVYRLDNGTLLWTTPWHYYDPPKTLSWSGDGRLLAAVGQLSDVNIWDVETGALVQAIVKDGDAKTVSEKVYFTPDNRLLVGMRAGPAPWAFTEGRLAVWEIATGRLMFELLHPSIDIYSYALSRDGQRLAIGGADGVGWLFDFNALMRAQVSTSAAADHSLQQHWQSLGSDDPAVARRAMLLMCDRPRETLALFERTIKVLPQEADSPEKLIAQLGASGPQERRQASAKLRELGPTANDAMRRALQSPDVPAEVRGRLELLLAAKTSAIASDELQRLRAVEALECIGGRQAVALLETIASGPPTARATLDARAALVRVKTRLSGP